MMRLLDGENLDGEVDDGRVGLLAVDEVGVHDLEVVARVVPREEELALVALQQAVHDHLWGKDE